MKHCAIKRLPLILIWLVKKYPSIVRASFLQTRFPSNQRCYCRDHLFCQSQSKRTTFMSQKRSFLQMKAENAAMSCNLHHYKTEQWQKYTEFMETIMNMDRVVKKFAPGDKKRVQEYLLSNERVIKDQEPLRVPSPSDACNASNFGDAITRQKELFVEATNFSNEEYKYLTTCLSYAGDYCAKKREGLPIAVAWEKVKECGFRPRENSVSTYMYVLSLDEAHLSSCLEVATFHDLLFEPTENTITLRIKSYILLGDAAAAEDLLESLPDKESQTGREWKRLRTFLPILSYHTERGDMLSLLRLFRRMRGSEGVHFDPDTYQFIISALAARGYFRSDSKPINGVKEWGFAATHGPALFDCIASEMADDILELTESACRGIYESMMEGFEGEQHHDEVQGTGIPSCAMIKDRLLVGRVTIDASNATCPDTGAKLRLFELTETQRNRVRETLLQMAASQHNDYGEKLKAKGKTISRDGDFARTELSNFTNWLRNREGEPYTAIVDGPNVAYFGHGDVHYSQVRLVVEELERIGERPLVIMPHKYITGIFWLSSLRKMQTLKNIDAQVINYLLDSGKMYVVPNGCLDDYYWMVASVADQGAPLPTVTPDDTSGRFRGVRPLLVTNDQMRDHQLALLEPRPFRRWTSCHIVNYDIQSYVLSEWENRTVTFVPADFFSREIQGNPSIKKNGTVAWHFPVDTWPENDRFVINIHY